MSQGNTVDTGDTGDQGRQQESVSGITLAEVETFASSLEHVAGRLREVAPQLASTDASDRMGARNALMIMTKYLADEMTAFSKNVER